MWWEEGTFKCCEMLRGEASAFSKVHRLEIHQNSSWTFVWLSTLTWMPSCPRRLVGSAGRCLTKTSATRSLHGQRRGAHYNQRRKKRAWVSGWVNERKSWKCKRWDGGGGESKRRSGTRLVHCTSLTLTETYLLVLLNCQPAALLPPHPSPTPMSAK